MRMIHMPQPPSQKEPAQLTPRTMAYHLVTLGTMTTTMTDTMTAMMTATMTEVTNAMMIAAQTGMILHIPSALTLNLLRHKITISEKTHKLTAPTHVLHVELAASVGTTIQLKTAVSPNLG